jgi:transcriptional regulator with XRE-family HTH domain
MPTPFDSEAFFSALNATRLSRRLNWKDVASQSGVQASTFSRMSDGKNPDVNGLAALLTWSGLKAEDFIPKHDGGAASGLAQAVAHLRADPNLQAKQSEVLVNILNAAYNTLKDT